VKLRRELDHLDRKEDPAAMQAHRKKWIAITKSHRQRMRRERELDD
jgi:hypothetical protein